MQKTTLQLSQNTLQVFYLNAQELTPNELSSIHYNGEEWQTLHFNSG